MAKATIKKVNAAISQYGVELVKDRAAGYFYFADIGEDFIADRISSVMSNTIECDTVAGWAEHVVSEINLAIERGEIEGPPLEFAG